MVLGGGWVGGRRIGVEGWGGIWVLETVGSTMEPLCWMSGEERKGEELGMLGLVVHDEGGLPPVLIVGHLNVLFCCA